MSSKILVVDDSPTELRLVTASLLDKGYQVITATNGNDALEKARQERPDLIVLDIIMPNPNGFQVCRELKKTGDTKDIKIIMLSSKDQESDRFWGMRQGADAYMSKPYKEETLLENVTRLL